MSIQILARAGLCLLAGALVPVPVQGCDLITGGSSVGCSSDQGIASTTNHNVGIYEKINATTWELRESWYEPGVGRFDNDIWVPASGGGPGGGGDDGGGGHVNTAPCLDLIVVSADLPGNGAGLGLWMVRAEVGPGGSGGPGGGGSYGDLGTNQGTVTSQPPTTCGATSQAVRNQLAWQAIHDVHQNNPPRGTYTVRIGDNSWQNFIASPRGGGFYVMPSGSCGGP